MDIVVVGSLGLDQICIVDRLPRHGETVMASESFNRFGGKGANQALAAARLGGRVAMIGAVGHEAAGAAYRSRLAAEGIDVAGVIEKAAPTGIAMIWVEASGENSIVVHSGANSQLTPADLQPFTGVIAAAKVMLLQLEVPLATTLEAMRLAREAGVPVVFNPSPWRNDFPWQTVTLHTVVVNETEAKVWLGQPRFPRDVALQRLVVTQGAGSTLGYNATDVLSIAPRPLRPVDTVGAGDAFAGALAVALAEGRNFAESICFANAAGGLATLAVGAQEALPTRRALDEWIAQA